MPFTQYYKTGNKRFHNLFQAFDSYKKSRQEISYCVDDAFITSIAGHSRPKDISKKAIVALMVKGLRQLRQKYSKLRLALGGGTDTWTILKLCIEHKIYLDEVVCGTVSFFGNVRADLEYLPALKYAKSYEGKGIGQVKAMPPTKESLQFINKPEWYKHTNGATLAIRPFFGDSIGKPLMNDPNSEFVNITGMDKPTILVEQGKPYWVLLDVRSISEWMGIKNHCPLFYDADNPELTVAMAYSFLDNVKDISKDGVYEYETIKDRKTKDVVLESFGMRLDKPWLNHHFLGKKKFNWNSKTKLFLKELEQIGESDYLDKWYKSMETIIENYKDVPYGIEVEGKHVKTIGRFSQRIPILENGFGYPQE
tara:strand:+ start:682 stop:1779 length:1098 start_codon:yes stop_codon:yes gene_type:complete